MSLLNVGAAPGAAACSALTEPPDHRTADARSANVTATYFFIMISLATLDDDSRARSSVSPGQVPWQRLRALMSQSSPTALHPATPLRRRATRPAARPRHGFH